MHRIFKLFSINTGFIFILWLLPLVNYLFSYNTMKINPVFIEETYPLLIFTHVRILVCVLSLPPIVIVIFTGVSVDLFLLWEDTCSLRTSVLSRYVIISVPEYLTVICFHIIDPTILSPVVNCCLYFKNMKVYLKSH
jgi:hypothetical protein